MSYTHHLWLHLSGIGKSAFAPLLISALASQGCRVIYVFKSDLADVMVLMDFSCPGPVSVDMQMFSPAMLLTWLVSVKVKRKSSNGITN